MPNRIIKESCRTSETLDKLTDGAERMFWRLTTVADDFGRFECNPSVLLANCFPLRVDNLKIGKIKAWFSELMECGLVTTYAVNGKQLAFFNTWDTHQRRRAQQSKYPPPSSDNICCQPPSNASESSIRGIEESRNRGIDTGARAAGKTKTAYPEDFKPSDRLIEWCSKQHVPDLTPHLEAFRDYHVSHGSRFLDWEAAFRTWIRNASKFGRINSGTDPPGGASQRIQRALVRGL